MRTYSNNLLILPEKTADFRDKDVRLEGKFLIAAEVINGCNVGQCSALRNIPKPLFCARVFKSSLFG